MSDTALNNFNAKVSCVLPVRPGRLGLCQRAIEAYAWQRHQARELLLVGPRDALREVTAWLATRGSEGLQGLIVVEAPTDTPAARLYSLGADKAAGGWLAFLDDDNLYHPDRLAHQLAATPASAEFSCYGEALWHFFDSREVFIVAMARNKAVGKAHAFARTVPYTALFRSAGFRGVPVMAGRHPLEGLFMAYTGKGRQPHVIAENPHHAVIGVRGDNLRGYHTHRDLCFAGDTGVLAEWLVGGGNAPLRAALDAYRWEPGQIDVCGRNGGAFTYEVIHTWPSEFQPVGEAKNGLQHLPG